MEGAIQEAWDEAYRKIEERKRASGFSSYAGDPVGFTKEILGIKKLTDGQIEVAESVRDNTVTLVRSANAVGKSHIAACISLWFFSVFPDSKIYATAAPPIENLKQVLWGEVMKIVNDHPSVTRGYRLRALSIRRNPASFITGVAIPMTGTAEQREAKFAGKHAPHLMFIVDEGDAVPDEVYKGIESCMSSGEDIDKNFADLLKSDMIRLLVLFNPRAKVGNIWQKEYRKEAKIVHLSALEHPNVVTGNTEIPGAVSRSTIVRRVNMWTRPLAVNEKASENQLFKPPDYLVGEITTAPDGTKYPPLTAHERIITQPEFSYMVLGQYPAQSAQQLISEDWIDMAVTRRKAYVAQYGEVPPYIRPKLGADLAEYGPDPNVVVLRYGTFISQPITWNGMDVDESALKILDYHVEHNADISYVDATGVGAGVAPRATREARRRRQEGDQRFADIRVVGIKVAEKPVPFIRPEEGDFYSLRDQLWWLVREFLRTDPGAMLPDDPLLKEDLMNIHYEKLTTGKIKMISKPELREKLKRSTDRGDALCLTFSPFDRPKWIMAVER